MPLRMIEMHSLMLRLEALRSLANEGLQSPLAPWQTLQFRWYNSCALIFSVAGLAAPDCALAGPVREQATIGTINPINAVR